MQPARHGDEASRREQRNGLQGSQPHAPCEMGVLETEREAIRMAQSAQSVLVKAVEGRLTVELLPDNVRPVFHDEVRQGILIFEVLELS